MNFYMLKPELTIETRVDASTGFFSKFCVTRLLVLGLDYQKIFCLYKRKKEKSAKLRFRAFVNMYSKLV